MARAIVAQQRGAAFTARAANGVLLGLVALSGFALTYASATLRTGWRRSLLAGWGSAALLGVLVGLVGHVLPFPGGLAVTTISLAVAYRVMPASAQGGVGGAPPPRDGSGIRMRMAATAALVVGLATAVQLLGPLIGGVLTALPVLASALAVFTHRDHGDHDAAPPRDAGRDDPALWAFAQCWRRWIVPAGALLAFATASATAIGLNALLLYRGSPALATEKPALDS